MNSKTFGNMNDYCFDMSDDAVNNAVILYNQERVGRGYSYVLEEPTRYVSEKGLMSREEKIASLQADIDKIK